jgi:hypothetical protein
MKRKILFDDHENPTTSEKGGRIMMSQTATVGPSRAQENSEEGLSAKIILTNTVGQSQAPNNLREGWAHHDHQNGYLQVKEMVEEFIQRMPGQLFRLQQLHFLPDLLFST